ncbi:hypothetical protein [Streptomyces alboflavus]|uniref:hypothetical protein n=1 Tax=Streptomyces alboflavus TaxID=67267 RepID=UPI000F657656|nr:hypothetical protein [Streptomyces alboflavus]
MPRRSNLKNSRTGAVAAGVLLLAVLTGVFATALSAPAPAPHPERSTVAWNSTGADWEPKA